MDTENTDPVEDAAGQRDLYEIATWEIRSPLDWFSAGLYWLAVRAGQALVILAAVVIFVAIGAFSAITNPTIGLLTAVSAFPALLLAAYVWRSDVTAIEPLSLVAATFILAVLTAGFAAVLNGVLNPMFAPIGFLGMLLFFYLVVKGLIVAAVIHATYNATLGLGSGAIQAVTGVPPLVASFSYILLYAGVFGYLLYRKLQRYGDAYRTTRAGESGVPQ